MGTADFTQKFQDVKITEDQDINILLLGETGVGKSTFINALANYLHYKSFKKASKGELLILIPALITVTNENLEQVTIQVGSDNNEFQEVGAAGTQDVKTYVFPIGEGKTRLRLIDSPGMGDPRGIKQDDINCENILAYLSQLKELHAICFLMRPTNTRKTILFEYCVKEILSRLDKSASKNIIFIFTNTRGTNYTPGETLPCLKNIVDGIKANQPHVEIPLSSDNTFSLDNEAFRFLVAVKGDVKFEEDVRYRFLESWAKSSRECWRLISYIVGDGSRDPLKPHQLFNTFSINEARRIIGQLSQPLADISQLIYDNIRILDKHKYNLKMDNQSLDELKKKLYIPIISLEVTQLAQPVTVCTSSKCADLVKLGEVKKWNYRQKCHDPCYLTDVTKEIVGDPKLMHCEAMRGRTCTKCSCDFTLHMHIYYMSKTVNDKIVDDVVRDNVNQKEAALNEAERLIEKINERKTELETEREVIIKTTAQIAHFLQHNAIAPFNDSYKTYIKYLIKREQGLGNHGDEGVIVNLVQLLNQYNEIKVAFDNGLKVDQQLGLTNVPSSISAHNIITTIHALYKLKHNGKKIHELFKKQKASRTAEYDKNCEYIHPKPTGVQDKVKAVKEKKKNENTTDDAKQTKLKQDKKKSAKSTDDKARDKNKKPTMIKKLSKSTQNLNAQQPSKAPSSSHVRERPPPYPGQNSGPRYNPESIQSTTHAKDDNPNVVVKVELTTQPTKKQGNNSDNVSPNLPPSYHGPPENPYLHQYHGGPSQRNYYGQYPGPIPQAQYHPPPPGQYYGPPPPGQYHGPPPPGQYHGPPLPGQYHGPPLGPYYGPPQGYYNEPGNYYGPPPGQYHNSFPLQDQYHNPVTDGRSNFPQKDSGGKRGKSKTRTNKAKKSEKKKVNRSSSESSSE